MRYFPAFFDLRGRRVLIVGGGEVAMRKLSLLERCGAEITVVAPQAVPQIGARALRGELRHLVREFQPHDLDGATLVIVATPHRALNRLIARQCDARQIAVNVVDDREASRFIVPAIIDRDPVLIAVCTGGASPVLARRIRERLEAAIPARLGDLARWLAQLRAKSGALRSTATRRRFFERLIDGPAARRLLEGDQQGATAIARQLLTQTAGDPRLEGEVLLVGAGPGDPELLTLKALRALQDADVILYDRLVSSAVLDLARRDALCLCVGKTGGGVSTPQAEINAAMIEHARRGMRVVRLKGGDPFIFGRGGEELEALSQAGVRVRVIPGVTAALGAAAATGIPLTHRNMAHAVTFATAQFGDDDEMADLDWRALAMPGRTAVIYMGLRRIGEIANRLLESGAPASRPAAVIAGAATPSQKLVAGNLGDIHARCLHAQLASPALLVVGDVVALHSHLNWPQNTAAAALSASA